MEDPGAKDAKAKFGGPAKIFYPFSTKDIKTTCLPESHIL